MSRFTAHAALEVLEDGDGRPILKGGRCQWRVITPLPFDVGAEASGEVITVPAGATTDLASIPRFAAHFAMARSMSPSPKPTSSRMNLLCVPMARSRKAKVGRRANVTVFTCARSCRTSV